MSLTISSYGIVPYPIRLFTMTFYTKEIPMNHRPILIQCCHKVRAIEGIDNDHPDNYTDQELRHILLMYPTIEQEYYDWLKQNNEKDIVSYD